MISVSEKFNPTDESLAVFEKYDGVQSLNLDSSGVTDKGLAALKKSHVLSLILNDCNITEVDNIASLDYLQTLSLRGTYINDSALAKLAKLKMLRVLDLRNCRLTDESLKQLIPSTSLKYVQLSQGKFSKKAIAELSESMPQCSFEGYTKECKVQEILAKKTGADLYNANQHAIEVAERINSNLSIIANCLSAMSLNHSLKKDYAQAEALLARARNLLEKNGNKVLLAEVLAQSAKLAQRQNHLEEFDDYADKSAKMSIDTMLHDSPDLMARLETLTVHLSDSKLFDKPIENSKRAIALIKQQSPSKADEFLPRFTERVGSYYFMQQKLSQALPYLKENLALRRVHKDKDPQAFARALIELAHCEPDRKSKKQSYEEGLDLIDALGYPTEENLLEHYCDACNGMVILFDEEKNQPEALRYSRRGLAVANMIRNDIYGRKTYFKKMVAKH